MRIVRTDCEIHLPRVDAALAGAGHDLVLLPDATSEKRLMAAAADAALILACYAPVSAGVIEAAGELRAIVKYGVGIDAIDIDAAKRRGVTVVNVPDYAHTTVAEGAFALMLAVAKKTAMIDAKLRRDGWAWPQPDWLATDIAGKTVGLVGLGRIGRMFARMAGAGFGARVVVFDPFVSAEQMRQVAVEKAEGLMQMLAEADIVSIHTVLNDSTRGLIGARELAAMKSTAILVNVSRGAIVDERALIAALRAGKLAGAGLDVFGDEPLTLTGHPLSALFDLPNVVLSPHLTFFADGALERLQDETLARCFEVLDGRPVLIKSRDPRLQGQTGNVVYGHS